MMVTAKHNRTDFSIANHFVELQSYFKPAHCVLIQNTCLSAYNHRVFFGIAYPIVIVAILTPAIRIDTFHGSTVCLDKILMSSAQTHPSERTVTIIEKHGSHYVLYI